MRRVVHSALAAIAAAFAFAACGDGISNDAGDTPSHGKTDSLFPDGADVLGRITIVPLTLPNVIPVQSYEIARDPLGLRRDVYQTFDGMAPTNFRVDGGKHWVMAGSGVRGASSAVIDVKAKETVTIALSGLHVDGYREYPVSLGITPQWTSGGRADVLIDAAKALSPGPFATTPGTYVQVLPGAFSYQLFGDTIIADRPVDVAPGALTDVDLAIPDPRVTFQVSTPTRALPDAAPVSYLGDGNRLTQPTFVALPQALPCETPGAGGHYYSSCIQTFNGSGKQASRVTAIGSNVTAQRYYLAVNGFYVEIKGDAGTTVEAPLRRLDVHDIAVEIEDGSTQTYKGTWTLEYFWPAAKQYVTADWFKNIPTGTGVDLVPGKYRATVSYERGQQPSPDVKVYDVEIK